MPCPYPVFSGVTMRIKMISILLLMLIGASLICAQRTELQLQEISRFAFSSHDMATMREPVIQYPYVFMPNSYGFQVSLWDSLAGSFTEVANYGVPGSVNELVAWQNYLFLAVSYNRFTNLSPEMGSLYRVDISDPLHPQPAGCLPLGEEHIEYRNLHVVNDVLLMYDDFYGGLENLILINPTDLSEIARYYGHYRFEVIRNQYVITRPPSTNQFNLFSVNPASGLEPMGTFHLSPYPINTFPLVFDVQANIVGTQCGEGIKLWNTSNLNNWELVSEINHPFSARGVFSNGFLIGANYEVDEDLTRLYVYSLADMANPILLSSAAYPPGLGYTESVERMVTYGSFLFHQCMNEGCICLNLQDTGTLSFVARCYQHSISLGHARKSGNYMLRPYYRSGVACFDVSNPYNPTLAFTLFEGNSVRIDICGNYLLALVAPNNGAAPTERIYNLSDPQNPQLVSSFPWTSQITPFFNYEEPNSFYRLDNANHTLQKYTITNNLAQLILAYPLPEDMYSPTFVNGLLYLATFSDCGEYNLYIYNGFPANEPQEPLYTASFFSSHYLDMYNAGDYAFVRTLDYYIPSLFYNSGSTLMVDSDLFGFNFRNYVCMGRENGVSFYDYSSAAGTYDWAEEDLFLPQCSYSGKIDWDDNYLYLSSNDNISIYSYKITTAAEDNINPPPGKVSNYPNPFNPSTTISFFVQLPGTVKLSIYNLKGQLVKVLVNESKTSGQHQIVWHGDDRNGKIVSSGIYYCKVETRGSTYSHKMLLMK